MLINKKKGIRDLYYGWWMVIYSGVATGLGMGFTGGGMSALFKPIAADLDMTRAATSWATGISRLQSGIEAPITGWLSDKFGPRWVIVAGFIIIVTGMFSMNYISEPWHYYLAWGVLIGMGSNLALTIAFDKSITNWFIRKSGFAFGVRFALIGVFSALSVPVISYLVTNEGWRTTSLAWAGLMALGIPLTLLIIRQYRPERYGLLPDGISPEEKEALEKDSEEESDEYEYTLKEAIRTRAFWLIVLAWTCSTLVMGAINIHLIPFLTDMGIGPIQAGGMMAMMVFFTVPARFLGGFLADRFRKDRLQYIAAAAFLIQALGIISFLFQQNVVMAYIMLALYGLGSGAPTPLRLTMGARYFGRKAFASILGVTVFLSAPLGMLAPIYTGWIYDTTGSYTLAFIIFAVLLITATLLVSLIRPPKPPRRVSGQGSVI